MLYSDKKRSLSNPPKHQHQNAKRIKIDPMDVCVARLRNYTLNQKKGLSSKSSKDNIKDVFQILSIHFENNTAQQWLDSRDRSPKELVFLIYNAGELADKNKVTTKLTIQQLTLIITAFAKLMHNRVDQVQIGSMIYGLGLLARAGNISGALDVRLLTQFSDEILQGDSLDISNVLYGMGLLVKAGNLSGEIDAELINQLLSKLSSADRAIHISKSLYGLGFLGGENHLDGNIKAEYLNGLLRQLANLTIEEKHAISMCFYGIGSLARKGKLDGKLVTRDLTTLLNILVEVSTGSEQEICDTLFGLGLLVDKAKLTDIMDAAVINVLLKQLDPFRNIEAKDINKVFSCLGAFAATKILMGMLEPNYVESLLNKLLKCRDYSTQVNSTQVICYTVYILGRLDDVGMLDCRLDRKYISEFLSRLIDDQTITIKERCITLYGLSLLGRANKLDYTLCVNDINSFLQPLVNIKSEVSQEISVMFYSMGLLAQAKALAAAISADFINNLLATIVNISNTLPSHICNLIYGLGLLARANCLDGQINAEIIKELLLALKNSHQKDSRRIANSLFGAALLANADKLDGVLDSDVINFLLRQLASSENLIPKSISNVCYDLGLLAKSGKIESPINGKSIVDLLDRLVDMREINSQDMAITLYGVGVLVKEEKLLVTNAQQLTQKLNHLVRKLLAMDASQYHLINYYQALYAARLLKDYHPCTGEQLHQLFTNVIPPFLITSIGLQLIDWISNFTEYSDSLADIFSKLVAQMPIPYENLSPNLRKKVDEILISLQHYESWYTEFNNKMHPPIVADVNAPADEHFINDHFINDQSSSVTENVLQESNSKRPTHRRARQHSQSQPSQRRPQRFTAASLANPVFKAICDNDISALQMLLGSQRSYVRTGSSVRSHSHSAAKNSLSNHTDHRSGRSASTSTSKGNHDNLAIQFFMHTDSEDLKKLIQISQARCFNFILHACTSHTRYQLAKVGALDGLIRYLAFKQLEIFIEELIKGGIGMYCDHVAILHIAQALSERCFQNPDENHALRTMIEHILDRALQHHKDRNNRRVVSIIEKYLNDFEQNKAQAIPESEIFENLMHESVLHHVELAGFDPQGIEEDTNPYENNEAEPSVQSYSSSYTSTFFALAKVADPKMTIDAIEDVNYLYTSEDIQAILPKRMARLEIYKPKLYKQLH